MLHFIPAWYQQNNWQENEQYWYARRMHTEFDDTVKHIQLFHRSGAYPFQIMLLSYAPNFRHFLHRQSVFHAPYWSCFDAIQEVKRKKVMMFSFHNLKWPEHIEFIYSPFVVVALLKREKYAQLEFGEDGNLIQIDIFEKGKIKRRNIYDDRGFVSSTTVYNADGTYYRDYLTEKGIWKLREYGNDGHVEINPKTKTYLLKRDGLEYIKIFSKLVYDSIEDVIYEVLSAYLQLLDKEDLFCGAMHELHTELLKKALVGRKQILSFFEDRYDIGMHTEDEEMIEKADYIIVDSQENLKRLQKRAKIELKNITDITPFDSRVDFGISQQLNVQKIMVPVDGLAEERFGELIQALGKYLTMNENARIHLFTRMAEYDRKKKLLENARKYLAAGGLEAGWAVEDTKKHVAENRVDNEEAVAVKFFVEQCVDELSVSKCIREQRIMVDMRKKTELYLRITGISVGIPQIVYRTTEFVEHGKNGLVIKDMSKLPESLAYYLENLTNWNEAMVHSYELGKKYTTGVLIEKWKEVIEFVG